MGHPEVAQCLCEISPACCGLLGMLMLALARCDGKAAELEVLAKHLMQDRDGKMDTAMKWLANNMAR